MYPARRPHHDHPWHFKLIVVTIALALAMVGVAGLVLPIIPGILFIALAILVLSRVSRRVDRWRREMPMMARLQRRMRMLGGLAWGDRVKAGLWMALGSIVDGTSTLVTVVSRTLARVTARRPN